MSFAAWKVLKDRAAMLLTAANKERTALGVEWKLSQMHGATGFNRQPVKELATQH
jgi:hypothetical protein